MKKIQHFLEFFKTKKASIKEKWAAPHGCSQIFYINDSLYSSKKPYLHGLHDQPNHRQ